MPGAAAKIDGQKEDENDNDDDDEYTAHRIPQHMYSTTACGGLTNNDDIHNSRLLQLWSNLCRDTVGRLDLEQIKYYCGATHYPILKTTLFVRQHQDGRQ